MDTQRIALMCAERDPLDCHRALLVARKLAEAGVPIKHIVADGTAETNEVFESRLLAACGLPESSLMQSREELVAAAYVAQAQRATKPR